MEKIYILKNEKPGYILLFDDIFTTPATPTPTPPFLIIVNNSSTCPLLQLSAIKLNRYGEDLLFFLFYMNGGDLIQLAAAAEL